MSDMVERVARAIVKAGGDDPDALLRWPDPDPCWKGAIPEAQAAIAAMQADAAPVAWMYERGSETIILQEPLHRDGVLRGATGWAETPLYAHPPVDDRVAATKPVDDRGSENTSGKMRDAVDVYLDAGAAYWGTDTSETDREGLKLAAAVIEADRAALVADILAMVDGSIAFDCNTADEARKAGIDASAIQGGAASLGRLRRAIKAKWGVK